MDRKGRMGDRVCGRMDFKSLIGVQGYQPRVNQDHIQISIKSGNSFNC